MITEFFLTKILHAEDFNGREYIVEEFTVCQKIPPLNPKYWKPLNNLYFVDGELAKYDENKSSFMIYSNNQVLKLVPCPQHYPA